VQSLRNFNQELLKQNNIKELLDDKIYLSIKFNKNIEILNELTKIGLLGGQTPVQLSLAHEIIKEKVLILVKDTDLRNLKATFEDMPRASVFSLSSFN
jgi:hypothetical protein